MAGGDSSSMAVVAADREADERLWKNEEPQQVDQDEEQDKGMNPLDPRFSEYDPKKREYIYTRYSYRRGRDINLDLDEECEFLSLLIFFSILVLVTLHHQLSYGSLLVMSASSYAF
jgi:hypothetical protein